MVEVKFTDGAAAPDDHLTSASLLLRDGDLTIDMFGEGELEPSSGERPFGNEPSDATPQRRCCVCGDDAVDAENTRDICRNCRDSVCCDPASFIDWVFSGKR